MRQRFGDYELLEEIARGGMGVIFKARQISLNRVVALKMILAGRFASESFIRRFRLEAEAAASLQHPNIVAIHEVGQHEGQHFFSMDFVEGKNLAELTRERPMAPRAAAACLKTLAEAIHYAHQRGIIHRDLKPSNVLIDPQGEPRITDFGLAKQLTSDSGITLTGEFLGSPSFLPPEQASRQWGDVGVHSDVYALGAILYFLLAGRPPFTAETLEGTLARVLGEEPLAPRLVKAGVPDELETICLKCLEKASAARYPSALALAEELGRFLADQPILARPISRPARCWRWCRRNPVVASLSAATALLVGVLAIASPIAAFRISRENQRATAAVEQSRQRLVRFNVASGNRAVTEGDSLGSLPWFAEALRLESGHPAEQDVQRARIESVLWQGPRLLQCWFQEGGMDTSEFRSKADALFSPDGRLVLMVATKLTAASGRESQVVLCDVATGDAAFGAITPGGVVYHAAFSPDGSRFLTAGGSFVHGASFEGRVQVWETSTGRALTAPLLHEGVVYDAAFSSDGARIATGTRKRRAGASVGGEAVVWDLAPGSTRSNRLAHAYEVTFVRFSPDGTRLVTGGLKSNPGRGEQHFARVWDAATGAPVTEPAALHGPLQDLRFGSDGIGLLAASAERLTDARVFEAGTGARSIPPMAHTAAVVDALFSKDGAFVLTASSDFTAQLWDASNGKPVIPPLKHDHFVRRAVFSPDGSRIATAGFDGTARLWDARTGAQVGAPLPHESFVVQVSFSPDGGRLLTRTVEQVIRLWEPSRPNPPKRLISHAGAVRFVQFSSDGTRLLTASVDGAARVWDVETGSRALPPLSHERAVNRACFSPNGKLVATASEDGTARVWDAATGEPATPPLRHSNAVWSVQFSPDNARLLTASGRPFRLARRFARAPAERAARTPTPRFVPERAEAAVWNVATGERLLTLDHAGSVTHAEFSADGRFIVTACVDHRVQVWDAASGAAMGAPLLHSSPVFHATFSPDARRVVTAESGGAFTSSGAVIWDLTAGATAASRLLHSDGVLHVAFSPDGQTVATASADGTARVWDVFTGEALTPSLRLSRQVNQVAFSPDGRLLLTCTAVDSARIWDARTGEPVTPLLPHPDAVMAGLFSPDGQRIATACRDGNVRVWDLRPSKLADPILSLHARVHAGRSLDKTGASLEPIPLHALSNAWQTLRSPSVDAGTGRGK